jgi:hypothetical protein
MIYVAFCIENCLAFVVLDSNIELKQKKPQDFSRGFMAKTPSGIQSTRGYVQRRLCANHPDGRF